MKQKVIDIFPPNRAQDTQFPELEETEDARPENRRSAGELKKWGLIVLILFAPAVVLHFFFAEVSIRIWPQITEVHLEEYITALPGIQAGNPEKRVLSARVFEDVKETTRVFSSTGTKEKDQKAGGLIRVYNNNSTEPQTLVATTRFISEDGKLFRSKERVVIPGGTNEGGKFVAGFLDVEVAAVQEGAEYNIGPSNFSLPGLVGTPLYTKIYGESLTDMRGGAESEVAVVMEADIVSARQQVITDLIQLATQSLLAKIPSGFIVLDDSFQSEVLADKSLVKEGAELDEFNYTARIRIKALGFKEDEGRLLALELIKDSLEPGDEINTDSLQVSYTSQKVEDDLSRMTVKTNIIIEEYRRVDFATLKSQLSGSSKSELSTILSEYPYLAKAEFSFWPFWVRSVPTEGSRTSMELVLEGN